MNAIVFILQNLERHAGQTIYEDCPRTLMISMRDVITVCTMPEQLIPISPQIITLGEKHTKQTQTVI